MFGQCSSLFVRRYRMLLEDPKGWIGLIFGTMIVVFMAIVMAMFLVGGMAGGLSMGGMTGDAVAEDVERQ